MPTLQTETPELAAQDPEAPPVQATEAEENSTNQHTPENSVVLTPEEIRAALDAGAMDAAEAQCIDLSDENGFFTWLLNFLFGWLGKDESQPEPAYSGWRTSGGKTYYYSQSTNKPVTGIQCIDNKLYYFSADGVLENGKTFGVDVSKYQKNIDWNQIKKAGVSFVIVRIGYRGYGASGTLVLDPMFEEHFTNVKNAGLKVGVYFFSQATTEAEAKEEAFACAYVLNGRKLDYPIFFDQGRIQSPGYRTGILFTGSTVKFFDFPLGYIHIIIISRSPDQIFPFVQNHPFGHITRVEHNSFQFGKHLRNTDRRQQFLKISLRKTRNKLIHRIVMMDTVSKEHFLRIDQKTLELIGIPIPGIFPDNPFQYFPDTQIIPVILIP